MKEDTDYPCFQEYAIKTQYQHTHTNSWDENYRTGSQDLGKSTKQSGYTLRNLPIIYNSDSRSGTPSKQSGSSRIVYQQKSKLEKYHLSSPRPPQEIMTSLPKPSVQTNPIMKQRDSRVLSMNIEVEKTNSRMQLENNNVQPYLNSNTVVGRQLMPQIGFNPAIYPPTATQTSLTPIYSHSEGAGVFGANPSHHIVQNGTKNMVSIVQENRSRELNIQTPVSSNFPQKPVPGMSHLSLETVPKIHFDKCVNECKNWETKYNQLYLKYMNLATAASEPREEVQQLKQENWRLKQQLKQKEDGRAAWMSMAEQKFAKMVNNQQEATIRECMLLMERFRLEAKNSKF